MRHRIRLVPIAVIGLVVALVPALAGARPGHAPNRGGDIARYILPPGNYGGLPITENSTDQLPLYSGLTPLRDDVTDADIERLLPPRGLPADRRDARGGDRPARASR